MCSPNPGPGAGHGAGHVWPVARADGIKMIDATSKATIAFLIKGIHLRFFMIIVDSYI